MSTKIKKTNYLIVIIPLAIAIGIIIGGYYSLFDISTFSSINAVIFAVVVICMSVILYSIIAASKSAKNDTHALGLPAGSIRAIIALSLIILFILVAIYFYQNSDITLREKLTENILTTLSTLVIAVSSFYFGVKATEHGSKMAQDTISKINESNNNDGQVPTSIIEEAIKKNKTEWLKKYNCTDIKSGTKLQGNQSTNINCIIFYVKEKKTNNTNGTNKVLNPMPYSAASGKKYLIPTDVKAKA